MEFMSYLMKYLKIVNLYKTNSENYEEKYMNINIEIKKKLNKKGSKEIKIHNKFKNAKLFENNNNLEIKEKSNEKRNKIIELYNKFGNPKL